METMEELDSQISKIIELAAEVQTNEKIRSQVNTDPLGTMRTRGIEVEEEFKESVEKQFKELTSDDIEFATVELMSGSAEPAQALKFRTNKWGLVLDLPPSAISEINQGILSVPKLAVKLLPALKAVISASTSNPILAALSITAAIWCSIQAAWILVEIAAINLVNAKHKKGVYLTWTWFGMAMTAYLPIVTPVK